MGGEAPVKRFLRRVMVLIKSSDVTNWSNGRRRSMVQKNMWCCVLKTD